MRTFLAGASGVIGIRLLPLLVAAGHEVAEAPIGEVAAILRSALIAERETDRFAQRGGRGVVLRFGLFDGPGTGHEQPLPASGPAPRHRRSPCAPPDGIHSISAWAAMPAMSNSTIETPGQ